MSRIAKAPVDVVSGVEVSIAGQEVTVKGKNGTLARVFNHAVEVVHEEEQPIAVPRDGIANAMGPSRYSALVIKCNGYWCNARF